MKNESGYTLIELFIVLIVFSIVVALFNDYFFNFLDSISLEESATYLLQNMRLFQEISCSKNTDYPDIMEFYPTIDLCIWKVYNLTSNTYKIYKIFDLKKYNVDLVSVNFGGNSSLHFSSFGAPSSGGTVVLKKGNQIRYIIVTPATGRIWISNEPPENW